MEGMNELSRLTEIHLQNNLIRKIECLEKLPLLRKLYLSHNCISRLDGLEGNKNLEELSLSDQSLPPQRSFTFDPRSLAVIAVISFSTCVINLTII